MNLDEIYPINKNVIDYNHHEFLSYKITVSASVTTWTKLWFPLERYLNESLFFLFPNISLKLKELLTWVKILWTFCNWKNWILFISLPDFVLISNKTFHKYTFTKKYISKNTLKFFHSQNNICYIIPLKMEFMSTSLHSFFKRFSQSFRTVKR